MQVSVEDTGGLERRLTVNIPEDEFIGKIETKLRDLCKQVKIKGFRPGRVPMSVVKQRYGKQVRREIVTEAMQFSLQQAIQDEKLRPATQPQVDRVPESLDKGDLEFSAVLEVYPDIGEIDVSTLEVSRPQATVEDEDVEEMLQTLRKQRRTWDAVERKAKAGDQVLLEYAADTDAGRVPEEDMQRLAIIMGESGFDELEKAIAKIPAGEEKNVKLNFPEGFREPKLAGLKVPVDLKVISVKESNLPEVNEEFIRDFGVEDGTEETLRAEIRLNLERELAQAINSITKRRLISALVKSRPDMQVPKGIVREEALSLAAQAASRQGMEPNESMADQFMPIAEERVRGGLLMGELSHINGIRSDGARVREAIETLASTYQQPEEVVQMYYSNENLLRQVESSVMEDQVVDWVLENAKVTPQELKFQEVIAKATSGE